jgi:arabinofuranan 3-O-arabinosyltransferase
VSWIRARTPGRWRDPAGQANLGTILVLVAFSFLQRPGDTTFDTKFDLSADPGAFLTRTLHLWNPQLSFGELQNQAYGYLFPQGTFFLVGDHLGAPDWVVQRLWSALILVAAYEGARRLYRAFRQDVGSWLPIVAGLAYAFSPRLLGLSGVLSAEVLPTAVLPWVVLPLVHALHGRMSPTRGALLSGCAVLFMGGVNAVENLATLPLPVLLLACSLASPVGRRLAAWWVLATALACAWWLLPLLVLGKYSPPFLDYIETSVATTRPLGWVNAVRGADHWLGFITVSGEKWWPGAFDLATDPLLIGVTAVVAALSLAGLFHPTMPARLPLALSAVLGFVLLTIGRHGELGSPLDGSVRSLLDSSLALLRNVHKVDPLVRLPFALGFAHAVGLLVARSSRASGLRARVGRFAPRLAVGAACAVLLVSAQPMFAGHLRKPGWDSVPQAWQQAADYLSEHAHGRRALVLPGSGFGQQTWGWTIDEPIQGVARTPWVSRSQVPLVPGPTIRFLDSLEERIQDGRGSPALAASLARAGISYIVVRRDLDLFASDAPSPARVDQALERSAGLLPVASFGSTGFGDQALISIYSVLRETPQVQAVETDSVATLAGGSEDVISLLEAGALDPARPTVVTPSDDQDAPDLVGDGYRRRERQFGRLRDSVSQVMAASESYRNDRRAHDYPGVAGTRRVAAVYPDISGLSASSSSGYADTLGPVRPELGPYSAVDGSDTTYWRSAPFEDPRGQWLEVRLKQPQPLSHVDVTVGVDGYSGVPVRRIRVDAGGQVSEQVVDPETGVVRVPLSGASVDRVRVTVLATFGDPDTGVVTIREISLPGLALGRDLQVPDVHADDDTGFVFRAAPDRRACVDSLVGQACEPAAARPSEEEAGLFRRFSTDGAGSWSISGTVGARAVPETSELLWPLGGEVRVGASSVLANDPAVSGQFAFDDDPRTAWLSGQGDPSPALVLQWARPRTLTRLRVEPAVGLARTPVVAEIESGGETRRVDLGSGSVGLFSPLRTNQVTIRFPMPKATADTATLPVGVGELKIDGLRSLTYAPQSAARTGADCGLGPDVVVDGHRVPTRVSGTLADVIGGAALTLEPCRGPVRLEAGDHEVSVASTDRFVPTTVSLLPAGGSEEAAVHTRATKVERWDATSRAVRVAPGAEALLRVPENVNAGWRATLDGKQLEKTTVDGWQQAYRVPAGAGGLVRLSYAPDRPYRLALLAGGIAAGILLLGCLLTGWRERRRVTIPAALPPGVAATIPSGWPAVATMLLLGWVLGGVPLAAGVVLGVLLRRRPVPRRWLAAGLVALVGIVAAVVAQVDPTASWAPFDAVTGGAIGLLVTALWTREAVRE